MRKIFLGAVLALTGCISASDMDARLQGLVGHPVGAAVDRLGPPVGQSAPSGARTYVWAMNRDVAVTSNPDQPNKFGVVPPVGMGGAGEIPDTTYNQRCWIRLEVGADDRVTGYAWSKDASGCAPFAARLGGL